MAAQSTVAGIVVAAAILVCAIIKCPDADAAGLSVVGSSAKVCQLTGQTDWLTGASTDAQTMSRYGLMGIDLGFPVESDTSALYLLFGDAVPAHHPSGSLPTVGDNAHCAARRERLSWHGLRRRCAARLARTPRGDAADPAGRIQCPHGRHLCRRSLLCVLLDQSLFDPRRVWTKRGSAARTARRECALF
jgi:hypothetical protein